MSIKEPKIEGTGVVDLVAMGVVKTVLETVAIPIVGNGTLKSGIPKLVAGGLIQGKAGKAGKILGTALIIDSVEDIAKALMTKVNMVPAGTDNGVW